MAEKKTKETTFDQVKPREKFRFQGRVYIKREKDDQVDERRYGGRAECQTDRSFDQRFFESAIVEAAVTAEVTAGE